YDLPLASFVGVNHHGHSTLLGCALITTTLQLCTDGNYRRPRSTECTDGFAVGIYNEVVGKNMAKLESKMAPLTDG
ncbi:hypothetical protein PIB30_107686, partial [Stylosanthes scabra]|nr:hypothetical protein [Stylosanthes scabra]